MTTMTRPAAPPVRSGATRPALRFPLALLLLCALLATLWPRPTLAGDRYAGVHLIRGTVISAGRVDPSARIGTGYFLDANYSSVAVNFGAATKKFGDSPLRRRVTPSDEDARAADKRVNNLYAGIGFGRILQLQAGYGNQGQVFRLRSDFNFRSISDFLTQHSTPKQRLTLADRITFTLAAEQYKGDDDIFNHITWGAGLLF